MMLTHLLTQTVTLAPQSGRTDGGDVTYGSQSTLPARIEWSKRLVIGADGNEVQADAVIVTETEIPRTSGVWLPDDTPASDPARLILSARKAQTPDGDFIYRAFV